MSFRIGGLIFASAVVVIGLGAPKIADASIDCQATRDDVERAICEAPVTEERTLGNYRLVRRQAKLTRDEIRPDSDRDGGRAVEIEIDWEQIDPAADPLAAAANERLRSIAHADWPPQDDDIDFGRRTSVYRINADFVPVTEETWIFGHGANHGLSETIEHNFIPGEWREIRASDIFLPNSGWEKILLREALDQLHNKEGIYGENPEYISSLIETTSYWRLTDDELVIGLPQWSVSMNMPGIDISWRDLSRYLNPRGPFRPAAEAAKRTLH